MKMVGIEEHVLPGEIRQAWTTLPDADDGTLTLNAPVIAERLADLGEKRLALMDETGIDMQVLSLTTPGLNNLGEHGVDLARRVNDRLAEVVQRHPSRFRALDSLPFASADAAARELSRAVTELGALVPFSTDESVTSISMMRCSKRRLRVRPNSMYLCLHPQIPQMAGRQPYYAGFSPTIDLAFSTFGLGWQLSCQLRGDT